MDDYDKLTEEDQILKRLNLLRKLGEMKYTHGITLTKNYNLNSDYYEMKTEYDIHVQEITQRDTEITPEMHIVAWIFGYMGNGTNSKTSHDCAKNNSQK
jgi:hypothetical protein